MEWLSDPNAWLGLASLVALEIVLGIDNLVFISILASRLPEDQRSRARRTGLALAVITRVALLLSIGWVLSLTQPLFEVAGRSVSGRDLILITGGMFLLFKSTKEIHHKLEAVPHASAAISVASYGSVVGQIVLLDIVFSLDSVITAVGMVSQVEIMIAAVVVAIGVMIAFADSISQFVERHPSIKMLALAFLVLIGANLIAEGLGQHIPKGYTYFAMAFSVSVELLNLRAARKRQYS
jgi:predicted tellurium resistance membrane protein TerC